MKKLSKKNRKLSRKIKKSSRKSSRKIKKSSRKLSRKIKKSSRKSSKKLSKKIIQSSKLERCILSVKNKMLENKILNKCANQKWSGKVGNKKCYNPWAVCRASLNRK